MPDRKAHLEIIFNIVIQYSTDVNGKGYFDDDTNIKNDSNLLNIVITAFHNNHTVQQLEEQISDFIYSDSYLNRYKDELLGLGVFGLHIINLIQNTRYINNTRQRLARINYSAAFSVVTSPIYILEYLPSNSIAYRTEKSSQIRFIELTSYRKCIIDDY